MCGSSSRSSPTSSAGTSGSPRKGSASIRAPWRTCGAPSSRRRSTCRPGAAAMSASGLTPAETAELLRSALAVITAEGAALSDEALAWRPAPGEWCVKEVLGHLIEAERRGFAGRIRIILAGDTPELETWDQNEVARSRRDHERSWSELLGEFTRIREESAGLARGLQP